MAFSQFSRAEKQICLRKLPGINSLPDKGIKGSGTK